MENREIFDYLEGGDVRLRFKTDSEVESFLARRCPALDLTGLLDPVAEPFKR